MHSLYVNNVIFSFWHGFIRGGVPKKWCVKWICKLTLSITVKYMHSLYVNNVILSFDMVL